MKKNEGKMKKTTDILAKAEKNSSLRRGKSKIHGLKWEKSSWEGGGNAGKKQGKDERTKE